MYRRAMYYQPGTWQGPGDTCRARTPPQHGANTNTPRQHWFGPARATWRTYALAPHLLPPISSTTRMQLPTLYLLLPPPLWYRTPDHYTRHAFTAIRRLVSRTEHPRVRCRTPRGSLPALHRSAAYITNGLRGRPVGLDDKRYLLSARATARGSYSRGITRATFLPFCPTFHTTFWITHPHHRATPTTPFSCSPVAALLP